MARILKPARQPLRQTMSEDHKVMVPSYFFQKQFIDDAVTKILKLG